ncbi:MAG: hypothetical protein JJE51_03875 [Thermoanaerobaculia bacterium]|nr:hypothetical protein [Thermoanaerobaculia bacterium]
MRPPTWAVLVCLLAVATSTFGVTSIGPEFLIAEPTTGAAPFERESPRIASSDNGYLVVWTDGRERNTTVRAARLSAAATVLDPLGLVLWRNPGRGVVITPTVASDGRDYLVACDHGGFPASISISRVSGEGVVSATSLDIQGSAPALAWNGRAFMLVYQSPPGAGQQAILAQRLAADATPIGSPLPIGFGSLPAVEGANDTFLAAWSAGNRINGRVLPADSPGPEREVGAAASASSIDIAWSGSEFVVVWNAQNVLNARSVAIDGLPLGSTRALVTAPLNVMHPAVAKAPSGVVITYSLRGAGPDPNGGIFSLRLSPDGSASTPVREAAAPENFGIEVAGGPSQMIAWLAYADQQMLPGGAQVLARPLAFGRPSLVSSSTPSQHEPQAAVSGASTLVSWIEPVGTEGTGTLFVVSTSTPRRYRIEEHSANQSFARLSGGDAPMILWLEEGQLRAKRLRSTGEPIDASPIVIAEEATSIAAVPVGELHFVFYTTADAVLLKRVNREGKVLDTTPIMVAATGPTPRMSNAATDGSGAVVTWSLSEPVCATCIPAISAEYAVISREGSLIAGPRRLVDRVAVTVLVVWNGSEYAIFAGGYLVLIEVPTVVGIERVRADGLLVGPRAFSYDASAWMDSLAWNGEEYITVGGNYSWNGAGILKRISRELKVTSTVVLQISDTRRTVPFVLARPGRSTLVVYEKPILDVPYLGVARIVGRSIDAASRIRAARR